MATKRRWWGKPAILLVVFAVLIAVGGLAYAHWTTSSYIEGSINTGNVFVGWGYEPGTDDDGNLANDPTGGDDGGGLYAAPPGHRNPADSSADPSDGHTYARYTKDVGACYAGIGGEQGEALQFWVDNSYPSYHCHVFAEAVNHGSVPVLPGALTLSAQKGHYELVAFWTSPNFPDEGVSIPFVEDETCRDGLRVDGRDYCILGDGPEGWYMDENGNEMYDPGEQMLWQEDEFFGSPIRVFADTGHPGSFFLGGEAQVEFHIEEGILCAPESQLDPGAPTGVSGWVHVLNPAEQNTTYTISLEQEWINWNEWDDSLCALNGVTPLP